MHFVTLPCASNDVEREKNSNVVCISSARGARDTNRRCGSTKPEVWPSLLRLYLKEQISSAGTSKERQDAVRLASELTKVRVG